MVGRAVDLDINDASSGWDNARPVDMREEFQALALCCRNKWIMCR
jgi:hypothetical protein